MHTETFLDIDLLSSFKLENDFPLNNQKFFFATLQVSDTKLTIFLNESCDPIQIKLMSQVGQLSLLKEISQFIFERVECLEQTKLILEVQL